MRRSASTPIVLFKPETGETLAIMKGGLITEMCATGATRPFVAPDAKIPGAGVQAKSHVEAMRCVRDFDKVRVWVRDPEKEKGFANEHGDVAMDAEDAVHGANVAVTATRSQVPVLQGEWLKEGAHINAFGAPIASWPELDDEVMSQCTVIAYSRNACVKKSGDVILSADKIYAEIRKVLADKVSADAEETTCSKVSASPCRHLRRADIVRKGGCLIQARAQAKPIPRTCCLSGSPLGPSDPLRSVCRCSAGCPSRSGCGRRASKSSHLPA